MNKLADRACEQVIEAEHLWACVQDVIFNPSASFIETSYLLNWHKKAVDAVHLCRLACDLLPQAELTALKRRIEAREEGLWDKYTLAEWMEDDTLEGTLFLL